MRPWITRAEIMEMKARGFDVKTIQQAEEQWSRQEMAMKLCQEIEAAFAEVTLGDGVGLSEGEAMDDWESKEVCVSRRLRDEKENWRRISVEDLNAFRSSPSYFDAEGMRFHLPALLIACLRGEYDNGMVFDLTYDFDYAQQRFSLLNRAQRRMVREYLNFSLDDSDESFHQQKILNALKGYWAE